MRYYVKKIGLIKATGKDVLDLINRLSSNEILDLKPFEHRKTILMNEKGRIVDLLNIFRLEDYFLVETSEGKEESIINFFDKYTFTEDAEFKKEEDHHKIIFVDRSAHHEEPYQFLNQLPFADPALLTEKNFIKENDLLIYKDNFKFESLNIAGKTEKVAEVSALLGEEELMPHKEYKEYRIKKGLPEKELNDQINPLECGLREFVSFEKGCYIGQEVIARLDAQKKIPKQMVQVTADDEIEENDKIFTVDGKEAGFISSSVSKDGSSIALGFIRSMFLDFEKKYFIMKENDNPPGRVINISKII